MIVYALIGKSGSGKSHRAQQISKEYGIEYIIDDGLLINGNRIAAGASAKREDTRIAAIKRAIFIDHDHRRQMCEAIEKLSPQSILVLGTSDNMIDRIIKTLELPEVSRRIYIEDIATAREIEMATRIRREQGKHVIPVPTFAIKKDFSGYFIDSVKNFRRRGKNIGEDEGEDTEKSVVRPTYSYLGRYTIANNVIKTMVSFSGENVKGIHKVIKVGIENRDNGMKIEMDVSVDYGNIIPDIVRNLKEYVKDEIEYMTAFNILEIDIYVKSLNFDMQ